MKTLKATQRFDSLYRRGKTGTIKEDDLFSLDDPNSFQQASSASLFNGYGFSDNEEEDKQTSFKIQESMYFDDASLDASEKSMVKDQNQPKKQEASSARSGGTLEDLFSQPASAKAAKNNGAKRSAFSNKTKESPKKPALLKSRSSPSVSELRRKSKPTSSGKSLMSNTDHMPSSSRKNPVWVDVDEYETDTDDDEDLEFASEKKPSSSAIRRKSVKDALKLAIGDTMKISKAPLKSVQSKMRIRDVLSLSNHRKDDSEKKQRSSERLMGALSISRHSTKGKPRSSSVPGKRQPRATVRKASSESSDATDDLRPKRSTSLSGQRRTTRKEPLDDCDHGRPSLKRSLSFSGQRRGLSPARKPVVEDSDRNVSRGLQRSSSFSGPRQHRSSVRKELFDRSERTTERRPPESSSERLSLEDTVSVSSAKKEKRRSTSSKPKRAKKKSLEQSMDDDDRSQKSGKKKRSSSAKRKKSKDLMDRSNHSQMTSPDAPRQRRVPKKKSSISMEDDQSVSSTSGQERRVPKARKMSPKPRRVPTKKSSKGPEDEESLPESSKSLSSNSDHGKRGSKSSILKKPGKTARASKTMRSKSPLRSSTLKARSEEFSIPTTTRRKVEKSPLESEALEARSEEFSVPTNRPRKKADSLSSSLHGRPGRRASKAGRRNSNEG